jgi:hypothetical protein
VRGTGLDLHTEQQPEVDARVVTSLNEHVRPQVVFGVWHHTPPELLEVRLHEALPRGPGGLSLRRLHRHQLRRSGVSKRASQMSAAAGTC